MKTDTLKKMLLMLLCVVSVNMTALCNWLPTPSAIMLTLSEILLTASKILPTASVTNFFLVLFRKDRMKSPVHP